MVHTADFLMQCGAERWLDHSCFHAMCYLLETLQSVGVDGGCLRDDAHLSGYVSGIGFCSKSSQARFGDRPKQVRFGDRPKQVRFPEPSTKVRIAPGPRCTGMRLSAHGVGCTPRSVTPSSSEGDEVSHVIECYNGNSWGTLKDRLAKTTALVVCAQEIGVDADRLGERVHVAKRLGWNML